MELIDLGLQTGSHVPRYTSTATAITIFGADAAIDNSITRPTTSTAPAIPSTGKCPLNFYIRLKSFHSIHVIGTPLSLFFFFSCFAKINTNTFYH